MGMQKSAAKVFERACRRASIVDKASRKESRCASDFKGYAVQLGLESEYIGHTFLKMETLAMWKLIYWRRCYLHRLWWALIALPPPRVSGANGAPGTARKNHRWDTSRTCNYNSGAT